MLLITGGNMIFEFTDYRHWLRHELAERIKENPSYSATAFSRRLGVSQAYLSLLLNGFRPLTESAAKKIKTGLKLADDEHEYLQLLVKKEEMQGGPFQEAFKRELKKFKADQGIDNLSLESFRFMSDWEHSAVLECLRIEHCDSTSTIAAKLELEVKVVQDCLKTLKKLGFVKIERKKWRRIDRGFLMTRHDFKDEALRKFHKQILQKASHALDLQSVEERNISGMTMAIDPRKIPEAKERIRKFTLELAEFLEAGHRESIYQLSINLFELKNTADGGY